METVNIAVPDSPKGMVWGKEEEVSFLVWSKSCGEGQHWEALHCWVFPAATCCSESCRGICPGFLWNHVQVSYQILCIKEVWIQYLDCFLKNKIVHIWGGGLLAVFLQTKMENMTKMFEGFAA